MPLTNEPIIILGAFRSGTSCLAVALSHLGVHLGEEKDFLPADQFNEGGYQELEDLQNLNAQCLGAFGMNYFQADRLPPDWQHFPGATEMVGAISSVLLKHFNDKPRWGWKEPSTTILLPLYKEALKTEGVTAPRFPISIRHPLSVAASQTRRQSKFGFAAPQLVFPESENLPVEQRTVGLWMHYTLSALRETKGYYRQVFSYESFLADPRPYLDHLVRGVAVWSACPEGMNAAIKTVDPSLSHSKFSLDDLKALPNIVARAYDCCLRAEKNPDDLNAGKFDDEIEALWQEWTYTSQMAKPILLPFTDMFISWQEGRTTVKYTAAETWQTVKGTVTAPGNARIQIDPTPLPCQIWIRKAIWRTNGKEQNAVLKQGINGIVEEHGMTRLLAYGPCPLITQTPDGQGPFELELQMMIVNHPFAMVDLITRMRHRLEQLNRSLGSRPTKS